MDKTNLQPLEAIYYAMENKNRVKIYETKTRNVHRGVVVGFDEYLNIVIDTGFSRYIIKGDCVSYLILKKEK